MFYVSLLEKALLGVLLVLHTEIEPVNPDEDYDVKTILDHRLVRGRTQYLIKWLDYLDSENI